MARSYFTQAKLLSLDGKEVADYRQQVAGYLAKVAGVDSRRLLWLVERAADKQAELIAQLEQEIVVRERFAASPHGNLVEQRQQHLEDFTFLYALWQMLKNQQVEAFGEQVAEMFGKKKKQVKK